MTKRIYIFLSFITLLISCEEKNKNISEILKINKSEALAIAKKYDISGENVEIYFKTYAYPQNSLKFKSGIKTLYYWTISKKCNHCNIIQIDAITGKVFTTGKYNYQY